MKESCCSFLALQAPTAPTVADTQKVTPAEIVSGAGTEMTLYYEENQKGGRYSRHE